MRILELAVKFFLLLFSVVPVSFFSRSVKRPFCLYTLGFSYSLLKNLRSIHKLQRHLQFWVREKKYFWRIFAKNQCMNIFNILLYIHPFPPPHNFTNKSPPTTRRRNMFKCSGQTMAKETGRNPPGNSSAGDKINATGILQNDISQ